MSVADFSDEACYEIFFDFIPVHGCNPEVEFFSDVRGFVNVRRPGSWSDVAVVHVQKVGFLQPFFAD